MLPKLLTSIFGSRNERLLKQYRRVVAQINALEPSFEALTDEALKAKTDEFRRRFAQGETLDALLPEAFAAVREGSKRTLKMRHFDVQLLGGMTLHNGKIAEMRTGEGKTLMATLPVYLNAISGKGVHVVTVNDYLARRDAEWMGRLYTFLGLTVGKLVGVLGTTAAVTRLTPLRLPDSIGLRDLLPVGLLAGIGFTVSLLIAELSFEDSKDAGGAKMAILIGTLVAAASAAALLRWDAGKVRDIDMNQDGVPDRDSACIGDDD